VNSLGLYTHSQSYRSLVSVGIKALARTIWPVSLKEAHEKSPNFSLTRAAWEPLFFLLTVGGLLSGAVGKEAIAILTHGKFTAVAGYVTCWFIYIAIQNAGKEHMAVLYVANQGVFITYLTVMCQFFFIGCLFVLIPFFGIWGAIVAAITQQVVYRIIIQIKATKIQTVPFNDGIVLNCISFVLVSLIVQMLFWDHFEYRITCFSLFMVFHIYLSRNAIKQLFSVLRRKWDDFLALSRPSSIKN
jgi:O-antigen/teichoic acid export membrane protein